MEANVLKELDIFSNTPDPGIPTNSTKEMEKPRLNSRQSLLRNFDPLYSSPLKNVMEVRQKTCISEEDSEKVVATDNHLPLIAIDESIETIKEDPPNQLSQENKSLLPKADEKVDEGNVTSILVSIGDDKEEEKLIDQPINNTEMISLTNNVEAVSSDVPELSIENQSKQNDCASSESSTPPSALEPETVTVTEGLQTNDVTIKEDDDTKKMDETMYFSPLKNVTEIKEISNTKDATILNVTQEKITENAKPEIKKIEMMDASTQYEEINPTVAACPAQDSKEAEYLQLLKQYEAQINSQSSTTGHLKQEQEALQKHFTTLEMAFSDVHQKYERTKTVLEGYRVNEQVLKKYVAEAEESVNNFEETKSLIKQRMIDNVNNCNKQLLTEHNRNQTEIHKLVKIIRMLEIKVKSVEKNLAQKNTECEDLTNLLNDVHGK